MVKHAHSSETPHVFVSGSSRAVVESWLQDSSYANPATHSSQSTPFIVENETQRGRLGLGAKPHSKGKSTGGQEPRFETHVGSKLRNKMKKVERRHAVEKADDDEPSAAKTVSDQSPSGSDPAKRKGKTASAIESTRSDTWNTTEIDSDDEEEEDERLSKTPPLQKRRLLDPVALIKGAFLNATGTPTTMKSSSVSNTKKPGKTIRIRERSEESKNFSSPSQPSDISSIPVIVEESVNPSSTSIDNESSHRRRKHRTRSRQKNIRKDHRPDSQRPSYLTPGSSDYLDVRARENSRKLYREHHVAQKTSDSGVRFRASELHSSLVSTQVIPKAEPRSSTPRPASPFVESEQNQLHTQPLFVEDRRGVVGRKQLRKQIRAPSTKIKTKKKMILSPSFSSHGNPSKRRVK